MNIIKTGPIREILNEFSDHPIFKCHSEGDHLYIYEYWEHIDTAAIVEILSEEDILKSISSDDPESDLNHILEELKEEGITEFPVKVIFI